jgi:hypothetical protein
MSSTLKVHIHSHENILFITDRANTTPQKNQEAAALGSMILGAEHFTTSPYSLFLISINIF